MSHCAVIAHVQLLRIISQSCRAPVGSVQRRHFVRVCRWRRRSVQMSVWVVLRAQSSSTPFCMAIIDIKCSYIVAINCRHGVAPLDSSPMHNAWSPASTLCVVQAHCCPSPLSQSTHTNHFNTQSNVKGDPEGYKDEFMLQVRTMHTFFTTRSAVHAPIISVHARVQYIHGYQCRLPCSTSTSSSSWRLGVAPLVASLHHQTSHSTCRAVPPLPCPHGHLHAGPGGEGYSQCECIMKPHHAACHAVPPLSRPHGHLQAEAEQRCQGVW